jgi:hypothetical protein
VSWNRSRFSQWEVEGEVRQRVGQALAQAERDRMADQCQAEKERPVVAGAMGRLKAGTGPLLVRVEAWVRALQVLEKGVGRAKRTG